MHIKGAFFKMPAFTHNLSRHGDSKNFTLLSFINIFDSPNNPSIIISLSLFKSNLKDLPEDSIIIFEALLFSINFLA